MPDAMPPVPASSSVIVMPPPRPGIDDRADDDDSADETHINFDAPSDAAGAPRPRLDFAGRGDSELRDVGPPPDMMGPPPDMMGPPPDMMGPPPDMLDDGHPHDMPSDMMAPWPGDSLDPVAPERLGAYPEEADPHAGTQYPPHGAMHGMPEDSWMGGNGGHDDDG